MPRFSRLFGFIIWSPLVGTPVCGVFQIRAFITAQFIINAFYHNAAIIVFTNKGTDMLGGTANTAFFN
jgi:hypothetical protein